MERNANKVLLTVIAIAVLIVATVGATFAYFSATGGSETKTITTGKLNVSASSSVADNVSIKPTKWTSAAVAETDSDIAKVGLDVVTDGTTITTGKYNISLVTTGIELKAETATVKGGALADVKWALYDVTTAEATLVQQGDFASGNMSGEILTYDGATPAVAKPIAIPAGTNTDKYKLYIWIEDNGVQDRLQGLTITAQLTVDAVQ